MPVPTEESKDTLKKFEGLQNKIRNLISSYQREVSNNMEEEFDSKHISNKRYLKSKIKFYDDQAPGFHYKEIPKVRYIYIYFFLKKKKTMIHKCF